MCFVSKICRLCLSNERRTYSLSNTVLQNVWEKLTNAKFENNDGRPFLVCYICQAQLKKAYELMHRSLEADELFTKYISNDGFDELMKFESLLVNKAKEIKYNYAIEHQPSVEFKQCETNIQAIREDHIYVKEEADIKSFADETFTTEEIPIEYEEYRIKEEQDGLPEFNYAESYAVDVGDRTYSVGDDSLRCSSLGKTLQSDIRIVLERIDSSVLKSKLDELPERAKSLNGRVKDRKYLPNTVFTVLKSPLNNSSEASDVNRFQNSSVDANSKISERKQIINSRVNCFPVTEISSIVTNVSNDKALDKNMIVQDEKPNISKVIGCVNPENESPSKSVSDVVPSTSLDRNEDAKSNFSNKMESENDLLCHICNYKCHSKRKLNIHLKIHTNKRSYSCNECDYVCPENSRLKRHVLRKHTKEKNFSCHMCDYKSFTKYTLAVHLRKHTGETRYFCDHCDYRSSVKLHLENHMRFKHIKTKNFSCHICDYKAVTIHDKNRHLRKYSGEKPHVCNECDYSCSVRSSLKRHVLYKHAKVKNFSCSICEQKFVTKADLDRHLRKHTGEKPYNCNLCEYSCSLKNSFLRHMQYRHTNEKNHSCNICEYRCVEKCHLDEHIRTHTGEKPFTCGFCEYRSTQRFTLIKHMKAIHKI